MGFEELGFDGLAKELDALGKMDEAAHVMLEAAAQILEKELKGRVHTEADKGYAKGDLEPSIGANKPRENYFGHYVSVTAKGKDRKGVRNNEKLAYLNYGTSKQDARPVVSQAVRGAEKECLQAMQGKFNEVTGQ